MATSESVAFEGKEYILSRDAAEKSGYTQDYIGQLARGGYVLARRVGGLWYINMESLESHKDGEEAEGGAASEEIQVVRGSQKSPARASLVMLDGKEYISTKQAAEDTGYAQDYVGQLIRSGKLAGRQVGGHWYAAKDAVEAHKGGRDAQMAKIHTAAFGLQKDTTPSRPTLADLGGGPLLKYLPPEESMDDLPVLTGNSSGKEEPRLQDSRLGISESRLDEEDVATSTRENNSKDDEEMPVRVRAMNADIERVSAGRLQQTPQKEAGAGRAVHRAVWNQRSDSPISSAKMSASNGIYMKLMFSIAALFLFCVIGLAIYFVAFVDSGTLAKVKEFTKGAVERAFVLFVPSLEYHRQ